MKLEILPFKLSEILVKGNLTLSLHKFKHCKANFMPEGLPSSKINLKKSFNKKSDEFTVPNCLIISGAFLSFSHIRLRYVLCIINGNTFAATEIIPSAPLLIASIIVKSSPDIIRKFLLIFLRNSIILLTSPDASFIPIILSDY